MTLTAYNLRNCAIRDYLVSVVASWRRGVGSSWRRGVVASWDHWGFTHGKKWCSISAGGSRSGAGLRIAGVGEAASTARTTAGLPDGPEGRQDGTIDPRGQDGIGVQAAKHEQDKGCQAGTYGPYKTVAQPRSEARELADKGFPVIKGSGDGISSPSGQIASASPNATPWCLPQYSTGSALCALIYRNWRVRPGRSIVSLHHGVAVMH